MITSTFGLRFAEGLSSAMALSAAASQESFECSLWWERAERAAMGPWRSAIVAPAADLCGTARGRLDWT
jgi:hypothetical protein